ncbi:ferredoxin [Nocardioides sp. BP30]|uniref:ferredoxin n=1 Tax=Nocardioides sp. BP30 TaxID=3036374 RepID=UPI002468F7F9|nr:ferredoxin [Nocardioides sp. BP30]WGL54149.1 ferredoxin [Nocardioides sp. BP30]
MSLGIEISEKCSGHGRCYVLEPGLFEPDDEGYAVALRTAVTGEADCASARRAATACPEGAILLTEVG